MTYNIHHGEGMDKKLDLDRIAGIIRAANADVVCLQEIDRNLPRTQHLDFPALLAEKLGMAAVFECNYVFDGGEYGNATLTHLEIVDHENLRLPGPPGAEPRGCLRTTVRVGDGQVDVWNAHFGLDESERRDQAAALLSALRDRPTILAGDFNDTAKGPAITAILERLRDTATDAKSARTKIDFIFASEEFELAGGSVFKTDETAVASDHLPWTADLRLKTVATSK